MADISTLSRRIEAALKDVIDDRLLRQASMLIRDTIYKRTKSGKGLTDGDADPGVARLKKLKPLSDSYIRQRLARKKAGFRSGEFFSPRRSNLTLTGALLNSLAVRKIGGQYQVIIKDSRRTDTRASNNEIAAFVSEERPFFGLANSELKRVESFLRRAIRQKLRTRRI
jgi:hypothetical protein